jgi:hypothetical protein
MTIQEARRTSAKATDDDDDNKVDDLVVLGTDGSLVEDALPAIINYLYHWNWNE